MRCFTLDKVGISLSFGGDFVSLGESGRGRSLVHFPLPPGASVADGRLMEVPGPATSALIMIPDQSGFRGSWRLTQSWTDQAWEDYVGLPPHASGCCGHQYACPRCYAWSRLPAEQPFSGPIIARGYKAQGDAGRAGGGEELLIVLRHGESVEIHRGGRLYGDPRVIRLECVAGSVVASDPHKAAEERLASRKFEAICTAEGDEPVEIRLSWGGGFARNRDANWEIRPHLRDPAGAIHVFNGTDIPGVCTVLEDVSVVRGYHRSRCAAYRVLLHPGVSLDGYRVPTSDTPPDPPGSGSPSLGTIGLALQDAGLT